MKYRNMQENQIPTTNTSLTIWLYILVTFTCLLVLVDVIYRQTDADQAYYDDSYIDTSECNVSWILVRWYIDTYEEFVDFEDETEGVPTITSADMVIAEIEAAEYDDNVKAIIVEIDSYGWSPVASEEIAQALKELEKPVYAHVRWMWVSGWYWVASSADTIYASKNSDIWSIGATMSYLDRTKYNEKEWWSYNQISSWKFKDSWSADKILTEEEKNLFQRDVDIIAENFIEAVSENRNIPLQQVQDMANGSTMLGAQALELGLIDKIWVMNEVYNDIEKDLGEEISICWN